MKNLSVTRRKWLITHLFAILAVLMAFSQAGVLLAASQPASESLIFRADASIANGAAIMTQEASLDAAYFAANGTLNGLEATETGLRLSQEQSSGSYESNPIDTPLAFTTDIVPLWQIDLPEGTEMILETRLQLDGGDWSEWFENPEAFYPVRDDEHGGNLIWVGSAQAALQFRITLYTNQVGLTPTLHRVTFVFNDTSAGPSDGEIAAQSANTAMAATVCPPPQPAVVSRAAWGNPDGSDSPRRPPEYQPVTHIILHQAETPNTLSPYQSWAGWVRSIWNYHANILGWGDVGYNYLIDPNGVIYEGRAGGDDVIGIHDSHNRGSMAIGFLGCYGNCDNRRLGVAEPGSAMLDSAMALMAWKFGQKEIDPLGSGPYAGRNNIPVIAGGRDVASTSSPGDNLYNKLPMLRQTVAEKVNCAPPPPLLPCQIKNILFDRERYNLGDSIYVTVRLVDSQGAPLAGAKVTGAVEKEIAAVQAATTIDLTDRTGDYMGVYSNTDAAGRYHFKIAASDPSGSRFQPCTAETVVTVGNTGPTLTPTPTPTSTPSPTPTPTVPASGVIVKVDPANLSICSGQTGSTSVKVENVQGLIGFDIQLSYDPGVVQVVDADPNQAGVQVAVAEPFKSSGFIVPHQVDTVNGRIAVAATLLNATLEGNHPLITINWQPQRTTTNPSPVTLAEDIILAGSNGPLQRTLQSGAIEVTAACSVTSGVAILQGRTNHSGIVVTISGGQQTQTQADGSFTVPAADNLTFSFPGYLSAQADVQSLLAQNQGTTGQAVSLGSLTLLAGDLNADKRIDILDLAYIAKVYGSGDVLADLNADGTVNIMDLVLAAGNYGRQGPLTNWR